MCRALSTKQSRLTADGGDGKTAGEDSKPLRGKGKLMVRMLKIFMRLGRMQTAGITGLLPVLGLWAAGSHLPVPSYLWLFAVGVLNHYAGFALNEFFDERIDRLSGELSGKPLLAGDISAAWAKLSSVAAISASLLLTWFFAPRPLAGLAINAGALALAVLYDSMGKRVPGMDVALAASAALGVLFGPVAYGSEIGALPALLAAAFAVQLLLQNTAAGLKDLDQDALAGAVSFPLWLGCWRKGDQLHITRSFYGWLWSVKIVQVTVLTTALIHSAPGGVRAGLTAALLFAGIVALRQLPVAPDRRAFFVRLGLHEVTGLLAILAAFYPAFGPNGAAVILAVPSVWAVVTVLWAHGGKPPVL